MNMSPKNAIKLRDIYIYIYIYIFEFSIRSMQSSLAHFGSIRPTLVQLGPFGPY